MYELKIKDSNGIWQSADLLPDEIPTMNYQVNSLAELKDRQANYSQSLKLPKTNKNVNIIKRADLFEVDTTVPYNVMECRLFSNGYALAGKGAIILIDKITDYIEVQILGGNADLFETLENLDADQIDLGYATVGDSNTNPSWVKKANCICGYFEETPQNRYEYFVNLYKAVEQILLSLGYTLATNLAANTKLYDYFSLPSKIPKTDSLTMFNSSLGFNGTFDRVLVPAGISSYVVMDVADNGLGTVVAESYTDGNFHAVYSVAFTSNINGKVKIVSALSGVVTDYYPNRTSFRFSYTAVKSTVDVVSYRPGEATINLAFNNEVEVEVTKGERIVFQASVQNFTSDAHSIRVNNLFISADITYVSADEVPTGGKLYFGNNIGFDNAQDLFKAFVQTYGLTVDVDNINKIVTANTMQKLYDNKSIAIDWSNKLHIKDSREMSFIIDGYARENKIKFGKKDDIEEIGIFNIANVNLEKTKDLFTLAWESGEDKTINDLPLASIPLYNYTALVSSIGDDTTREIQDGKPHLVALTIFQGIGLIANHIKAQTLIDTYYIDLTSKMLAKAKRIEALFNLTEIDIEAFNPFTPIYVSYYGAYFYVEKINNFTQGQLTKVNLIKL